MLGELGALGLMLGLEGACLGEGVLIEGLDRDGRLELIDGLGRGLGLRDGMLRPGEIDRLPMDGLLRRVEIEKPPR